MSAQRDTSRSSVTVWLPMALHDVLKNLSKSEAPSVSAWIRDAIIAQLLRQTTPRLQDIAKRSTPKRALEAQGLLQSVRSAISSSSDPGRLRNKRLRGYYMLYCRECKRRKMRRAPFALWCTMIDEISLTDPAGHSAPTPAAKQGALIERKARAEAKAQRHADAMTALSARDLLLGPRIGRNLTRPPTDPL